jgi:hypothetical protein
MTKKPLTEAERDALYADVLHGLSKTVFSPKTEGSWLD